MLMGKREDAALLSRGEGELCGAVLSWQRGLPQATLWGCGLRRGLRGQSPGARDWVLSTKV